MVFENAKFMTKITGALTASSEGSFILTCVRCALCWLDQAMSLSFLPPHPPSWENHVVFSHLNLFSVALYQPDVACAENEANRIEIVACTILPVTQSFA